MIWQWKLRRELRQVGADKAEHVSLQHVASRFHGAVPALRPEAKAAIAAEIGFRPMYASRRRTIGLAGAIAVIVVVIGLAQFAAPNSPLYTIRRDTQNVRAYFQPSYKKALLKHRQQMQTTDQTKPTIPVATSPNDDQGSDDHGHGNDSQPQQEGTLHDANDDSRITVNGQPIAGQHDDNGATTDAHGSSGGSSGSGNGRHSDD